MILEKIFTLANNKVRLPFLAMERSLRACRCDLPLMVIPYDNKKFALPPNASWWEVPSIISFLASNKAHPMMRKYQCFTSKNYQFVDSDVCFIRNPAKVLESHSGFVTCCGHWHNIEHACNEQVVTLLSSTSTTWQKQLFNAGQFASDSTLYDEQELLNSLSDAEYNKTTLFWPHNDQPGLNLLVALSKIKITNLTLPPLNFESSWAGDYPNNFESFWVNESTKPYLIHWAGLIPDGTRPIDQIFLEYLTKSERNEWLNQSARHKRVEPSPLGRIKAGLRKIAGYL